ncbi:MAG: hypothetical protein CK526_03910 [Thaumarchaeota archaeon]|nr:hypothetical protein [Nitrosopumilus sp.]PHY04104.1 MAG: hypothetical protein CK526_03910 [Nitrososphaerota archaeon]
MNSKFLLVLFLIGLVPFIFTNSYAAYDDDSITSGNFGNSPFNREFGDVKLLDAYFGTLDKKIEVEAGDKNVPFTIEFANVGTQDITGIQGRLALPLGFSGSDGPGNAINSNTNANSEAGENFSLTFYVNLDKKLQIRQYSGTVELDYSRLRESGIRSSYSNFDFKVTGDSTINVRASESFLTSLKSNNFVVNIINDGTASISGVDVTIDNVQTSLSANTASITNIENVLILETSWDLGNIPEKSSNSFIMDVYVPESLKGDTLRIPLSISYYNTQGDKETIKKILDFYIRGLIDLTIFNVKVIELSGTQMVIGEIINEGNEDALFGFVTIEANGDSNIKSNTQFIDEIEIDAPIPFNIPIEFDGEPKYGEHDVTLTLRYKDSVRDEILLPYQTTIIVNQPAILDGDNFNPAIVIIPIILVIGFAIFIILRRKKAGLPVNWRLIFDLKNRIK